MAPEHHTIKTYFHPKPGSRGCYKAGPPCVQQKIENLTIGCPLAAGGNLAAVVCILARDRAGPKLAYQLLYYPVVGTTVDEPSSISEFASMAEFGPGAEGPLSSEDHFKLINTCENGVC